MPINYKDYHPKWKLIVRLIRKRSRNRCELCGLDNHKIIRRLPDGSWRTPCAQEWDMIHSKVKYGQYSMAQSLKFHGFTKVILTTAHMDHDKNNNRFWNLKHLCQRCHLHHDRHQHAANRKYGRGWKRDQLGLFC